MESFMIGPWPSHAPMLTHPWWNNGEGMLMSWLMHGLWLVHGEHPRAKWNFAGTPPVPRLSVVWCSSRRPPPSLPTLRWGAGRPSRSSISHGVGGRYAGCAQRDTRSLCGASPRTTARRLHESLMHVSSMVQWCLGEVFLLFAVLMLMLVVRLMSLLVVLFRLAV